MPQLPKSFIPDKDEEDITLPKSFVADPVEEKGIIDKLFDKGKEILANPRLKEIADRALTGTSPEYEKMLKDAGISKVLGTPESETSLFPAWKSQPETYAGGFMKSLYNDLVVPLGTPSGVVGSADTTGHNPFNIGVKPPINPQKLLPSGPRFYGSGEGVIDVANIADRSNALPISREIPFRGPESYDTTDKGMVDAFRTVAIRGRKQERYTEAAKPTLGEIFDEGARRIENINKSPEDMIVKPKSFIPDEEPSRLSRLASDETGSIPLHQQWKIDANNKAKEIDNTPNRVGEMSLSDLLELEKGGNILDPKNNVKEILKGKGRGGKEALEDLKSDILENGIKQPITIRDMEDGTYSIFNGRHRLAALDQLYDDYNVPVEVINKDFSHIKPKSFVADEVSNETALNRSRPEKPDYALRVLSDAGDGNPGLSVEIQPSKIPSLGDSQVISYRGSDGKPIAVARIIQDSNGKWMVEDLAADKTKGLAYGRAVKAVGQKLRDLGIDTPAGTVTPDASNLIEKAKNYPSDIPKSLQDETELSGGMWMPGGTGGGGKRATPRPGPIGAAVDKLMSSMQASKGIRTKQDALRRAEQARRFSEFEGVKTGGMTGAKQSLSRLKGEYPKINRSPIQLSDDESNLLFDAVKRANITTPEKARSYTALFKILEGGEVPQRNELALLNDVFGSGFAEQIIEMHGGLGAAGMKLAKTANTMKAMSSSLDLSAPLRQGIGLVHRKEWRDSFGEMFKYLGNKEYYNNAMTQLQRRPTYLLGRESGLFLAKPDTILGSEEAFLNNYVHHIPGIRNLVESSERAYTGFLNKLRADTFDNMIAQARGLGHDAFTVVRDAEGNNTIAPSATTEAIARYINNATGRGSLGKLEKAAPELNTLLWSPRLISSRLSMLTNPTIYTDMPKGMRLDALKSLLGIAALGTTTMALGAAAGGRVSTNLLSADAGKVRFGSKVLDPWGGFQQPVVAASRFLAGRNERGNQNRATTVGRFAANKLSPISSLIYDLMSAQKFTGKGMKTDVSDIGDISKTGGYIDQYGNRKTIPKEILLRFTPMFTQDLYDLATSDPGFAESVGLNSALAGLSAAGMGVQDYAERRATKQLAMRRMVP